MDSWSRSTPWKQGMFLTKETSEELGITDGDPNTAVIVVTHDCDLAQLPESEPCIELVVGKLIDEKQVDGNFTNAKTARKLHLPIASANKPFLELEATQKISIDKQALLGHFPSTPQLSKESKVILQRWLASRYRRSAFPDAFESRLRHHKLDKKIAEAGKKLGSDISVIYFDIRKNEAENQGNFLLDIVILYNTSMEADSARRSAETFKDKIKTAFESRLYNENDDSWEGIELGYVDAISDESLSYKQAQNLKAWRLEYISLGADPQQPISEE